MSGRAVEGRRIIRVVAGLVLPLLLVACGGGKGKSPSGASTEELDYLLVHNARFNDGKTVRWAGLPIRVFPNGVAQPDEVTEWTRVTGGAVTFAFVGSASDANITFGFGAEGPDVCGITNVVYRADGEIQSADVRVVEAIYRGPQCQRTVVHEVGHAIGFLDHSSDGGLMDPDGGNGEITEPVATMFRNLYSMAPGSPVGRGERTRTALRRSGGGYVVTIVDYARR